MADLDWVLMRASAIDDVLVDADEDSMLRWRLTPPDPLADDELIEQLARAICSADGVDPERPCPGIGNRIPVGETWPAWKVRVTQARAVLELLRRDHARTPPD